MKVMYRPSPRQVSTKQIFTEKWHESRSAALHYLNRRDINLVPNGDLIRSRALFDPFPQVIRNPRNYYWLRAPQAEPERCTLFVTAARTSSNSRASIG